MCHQSGPAHTWAPGSAGVRGRAVRGRWAPRRHLHRGREQRGLCWPHPRPLCLPSCPFFSVEVGLSTRTRMNFCTHAGPQGCPRVLPRPVFQQRWFLVRVAQRFSDLVKTEPYCRLPGWLAHGQGQLILSTVCSVPLDVWRVTAPPHAGGHLVVSR